MLESSTVNTLGSEYISIRALSTSVISAFEDREVATERLRQAQHVRSDHPCFLFIEMPLFDTSSRLISQIKVE
jgi:hypothetical protein